MPLNEFPTEALVAGSEVNILVGKINRYMAELMFEAADPDETDPDEVVIQAPEDITWPRLLAALGCFSSVTQAKKNWCDAQKRPIEIVGGYSTIQVGKARKITIHLWKPMHEFAQETES